MYWSHNERQTIWVPETDHTRKNLAGKGLLVIVRIHGWRTCIVGIIAPPQIYSEWLYLGYKSWCGLPTSGQKGWTMKKEVNNPHSWSQRIRLPFLASHFPASSGCWTADKVMKLKSTLLWRWDSSLQWLSCHLAVSSLRSKFCAAAMNGRLRLNLLFDTSW